MYNFQMSEIKLKHSLASIKNLEILLHRVLTDPELNYTWMNLRNIVVVLLEFRTSSSVCFCFFRIMNFVCVKLGPKYTILLLLLAFRTNDVDSLWVRYSKWPVFGHSLYVILRCHFHMFWLFLHHYPQLWKKTKKYFSMISIYGNSIHFFNADICFKIC